MRRMFLVFGILSIWIEKSWTITWNSTTIHIFWIINSSSCHTRTITRMFIILMTTAWTFCCWHLLYYLLKNTLWMIIMNCSLVSTSRLPSKELLLTSSTLVFWTTSHCIDRFKNETQSKIDFTFFTGLTRKTLTFLLASLYAASLEEASTCPETIRFNFLLRPVIWNVGNLFYDPLKYRLGIYLFSLWFKSMPILSSIWMRLRIFTSNYCWKMMLSIGQTTCVADRCVRIFWQT